MKTTRLAELVVRTRETQGLTFNPGRQGEHLDAKTLIMIGRNLRRVEIHDRTLLDT